MRRRCVRAGLGLATVATLAAWAAAQCPREWASGFQVPGVNGPVYALAVFDDGHGPALFLGGHFTYAEATPVVNVTRWDGHQWSALGDEFPHEVYALVVYDDGSGPALFGGGFDGNVSKWDGQRWSNIGFVDGMICSFGVHDDGTGAALYVGGEFTRTQAGPASCIARWDGHTWSALGAGVWIYEWDPSVLAIASFDDGRGPALYAGGMFTNAGAVSAYGIARWDGTAWSALAGQGLDGPALALTVFDDGPGPALFVGGNFIYAGNVRANGVARYDGSVWSPLGAGFPDGGVRTLAAYDDGTGISLFAAGGIDSPPGVSPWFLARWNGSSWEEAAARLSERTWSLTSFTPPAGTAGLYLGGEFTLAGPVACPHVARYDPSGFTALGSGLGVPLGVGSLCYRDDERDPALYVGPYRTGNIQVWTNSGWSVLPGTFDGLVAALEFYDEGAGPVLFAGGSFGTPIVSTLARWDGHLWSSVGGLTSTAVLTLCIYDDGTGPALYAAGDRLILPADHSGVKVARWNGVYWSALGGDVNFVVFSSVVYDDGRGPALYVCGDMTTPQGTPLGHIGRWDGRAWTGVGGGLPDDPAHALAVFDDGRGPALYLGGWFTSIGGTPANSMARWDGRQWTALDSGIDGPVYALAVGDEGGAPVLYATGSFSTAGGHPAPNAACWTGHGWLPLGGGLGDLSWRTSMAIGLHPGRPALFVGGNFDTAGGHASQGFCHLAVRRERAGR